MDFLGERHDTVVDIVFLFSPGNAGARQVAIGGVKCTMKTLGGEDITVTIRGVRGVLVDLSAVSTETCLLTVFGIFCR